MNPLKNLGIDELHSGVSTGADWLEGYGPLTNREAPSTANQLQKSGLPV